MGFLHAPDHCHMRALQGLCFIQHSFYSATCPPTALMDCPAALALARISPLSLIFPSLSHCPPHHHQVNSLGYKDLVTFHSFDKRGKSVYHTNVMMAIGTDVAIVCAESVTDDKERQHLLVSWHWLVSVCVCLCWERGTANTC